MEVNVVFLQTLLNNDDEIEVKHFNTKNNITDLTTNLKYWYNEHIEDQILNELEQFQERESGWASYEILYI